ncbi:MAG: hypothetical protein R2939_12530 [Kofleriaceae bacterium]
MRTRLVRTGTSFLALVCALLVGVAACEDVTHENLDKWKTTKKGEGKLREALLAKSGDVDLSAHAAANLISTGKADVVRAAFESGLPVDRRPLVAAKLAPRLWPMARIEGELAIPSGEQIQAKDALYELRAVADDATRATIDTYLIDWYTSGYYEGRANLGLHPGAKVMRTLARAAEVGMISAANSVVARPPTGADGRTRLKIGDELLLGLAAVATPKAVAFVLDIVGMTDRGDATLPGRAIDALYKVFVDSGGLIEVAPPDGLVPNLEKISAIVRNDDFPVRVSNDAIVLLRAAGPPHCVQPLISLISYPQRDLAYVGANNALKCGGALAVVLVGMALPTDRRYQHEAIAGAVWSEFPQLPRAEVIAALRELLGNPSWVARWIAVEGLGKLASTEDKARIAALAKDRARLVGYWGDQDLPAKERKAEPTLGDRAAAISAAM